MSSRTLAFSVPGHVHENEPVHVDAGIVVNAGYTGRNEDAVRAHVAELALQGVRPPPAVPMYYRLPPAILTQASHIEVTGERTSGEIEYVLILTNRQVLVTVGSDHTDRAVETADVLLSKQVCPNVCATEAWPLDEVLDHWDELILRAWCRTADGSWTLYQEGTCERLIPPGALIESVRTRVPDAQRGSDVVIFSGTIAAAEGLSALGSSFKGEMFDPRLKRSLHFTYHLTRLPQPDSPQTASTAAGAAEPDLPQTTKSNVTSRRWGIGIVVAWSLSWLLTLGPAAGEASLPLIVIVQTIIAVVALVLGVANARHGAPETGRTS